MMKWTIEELTIARDAVSHLLAGLGLAEYTFTVEPRGAAGCEVRIEYAADEGWKSATLAVDDEAVLFASRQDPSAEGRLARSWREALRHARYTS
jgi:hypothetical protein